MKKISIPYMGEEQGTTLGGTRSVQIDARDLWARLTPADMRALYVARPALAAKGRFLPSRDLVYRLLEASVEMLTKGSGLPWSWQGFGMFRLYLSREVRLHVWAPATAVPNVTTIHSHPWDFESKVIIGTMIDMRYRVALATEVEREPGRPEGASAYQPERFHEQTIRCGPGGCAVGVSREVFLLPDRRSSGTYQAGSGYSMKAAELHESLPETGTVTIIRRTFHADTEHAHVYHRAGTPWVSAEPRDATPEEVVAMAKLVLDQRGSSGAGG